MAVVLGTTEKEMQNNNNVSIVIKRGLPIKDLFTSTIQKVETNTKGENYRKDQIMAPSLFPRQLYRRRFEKLST